jgi:hypothetical protein
MNRPGLQRRAREFCQREGLVVGATLGFGVHGIVLAAQSQAKAGRLAIKVHEREVDYCRERDVYLRLQEQGITDIRGNAVPELIAYDNELWVIEMTVVTRPFVLDFAGAFLDQAPGFSEEVRADWQAEKVEQFGARWQETQAIMRFLESHGIFLVDVTPNNIATLEGP